MTKGGDMLSELQRRHTIAALHKAGTGIRAAELERIKMSANILLVRAGAVYKSIRRKDSMLIRGLSSLEKIDEADTDDEVFKQSIRGLGALVEDVATIAMVQPEVDGIIMATNDIIGQLEKEGVCFSFPRFISYPGITACKFNLERVIGFLEGVVK